MRDDAVLRRDAAHVKVLAEDGNSYGAERANVHEASVPSSEVQAL